MDKDNKRFSELSKGLDWAGRKIDRRPKMFGQKYNKKCPTCDAKKATFFWKGEYYLTHCLCCGAYAPRNLLEFVR